MALGLDTQTYPYIYTVRMKVIQDTRTAWVWFKNNIISNNSDASDVALRSFDI